MKWTLCSDKMPDKDGEYLVAGKNCQGGVVTTVDQYFSGLGFFDDFQSDAIAWVEMPKYEIQSGAESGGKVGGRKMKIEEVMEKIRTGEEMQIGIRDIVELVFEKEHASLVDRYRKPFMFSPTSMESEAYNAGVTTLVGKILHGIVELIPGAAEGWE